jgi:hypothetical protein
MRPTKNVPHAGAVALAIGLLLSANGAAHHSPAAFDLGKEVRLEGKLTRYAYNNPHTYLTLEIVGGDGARVTQQVEAGPISNMQPLGLMRDSLNVGESVVVRANPNRRGPGYTVLGLDVTRADGKVFPLFVTSASVRAARAAVATSIAGVWRPPVSSFMALNTAVGSWPLTAEGRQKLTDNRSANRTTHSDCIPAGAPMLMAYPVASTVKVDATKVVFDIDWLDAERVVHLDVAAHPADLEPSLQGHSIGRWEGNTLVVDTIGFAPHEEGLGFGMASSERKHLVERFALDDDRRHLVYDVTVEDPAYLTQPVRHSARWEYSPDLAPSGVACDLAVAREYLRESERD